MIFHVAFQLNILCYVWLTFSITNCNKNIPPDIEGVKLTVQYPIVRDGEIMYLMDTVPIFYYKNLVLYKVPHLETYSVNGELIHEEKIFDSFLFETDSSFGFFFLTRENSAKPKKLPVDSFLLVRAYRSGFPFDLSRLSLVEKKEERQSLTETYIERSGNGFDSTILFFDKSYNSVPYSFNYKLDSARGRKLIKISMVLADTFSGKYNMKFPKREFMFKIERLAIPDPDSIKTFIRTLVTRVAEV